MIGGSVEPLEPTFSTDVTTEQQRKGIFVSHSQRIQGSCPQYHFAGLKCVTGTLAKNTADHYWGTANCCTCIILFVIYLLFYTLSSLHNGLSQRREHQDRWDFLPPSSPNCIRVLTVCYSVACNALFHSQGNPGR